MKNINFGKLIGEKETREGKVNVERQFYMAEKGESENQPQHLMESPGDSEDSFSLALSDPADSQVSSSGLMGHLLTREDNEEGNIHRGPENHNE
ncbi:hypothetical protein RUM44_006955 [Polyplax serrata]|uniref:Uncharacterized protein n=1 Tax=Polyplax serrata TaxID=468196 RepID=A0ABR1AZC1_POLSC